MTIIIMTADQAKNFCSAGCRGGLRGGGGAGELGLLLGMSSARAHNDCQSSRRATPKMLTHLLSFFLGRRDQWGRVRGRKGAGQRDEWKPHSRWGRCVLYCAVLLQLPSYCCSPNTDDKSLQFIYVPFRSKIFVRFLWLGGIPRQPELSTFLRFPLARVAAVTAGSSQKSWCADDVASGRI